MLSGVCIMILQNVAFFTLRFLPRSFIRNIASQVNVLKRTPITFDFFVLEALRPRKDEEECIIR